MGSNSGYYSGPNAWFVKTFEELGYSVKWASSSVNKVKRVIDFVALILKNKLKTDLVIIDTYSTSAFYFAYYISFLCKKFKLSYILILHGGNLPKRFDKSEKLILKMFTHAYEIITPSKYLKHEVLCRRLGNPIVIPNPIEIDRYIYTQRTKIQPILLWVRSLQVIYNPMMALNVLKLLKSKYNNAFLYIVGPDKGNMIKELKEFVELNSLEENIEFTGRLSLEDWTMLSKQACVFINTTNIDNTPTSVLEAMALGIPVVSTNVGGIPYIINNNKNGFLCNPGDVKGMTKIIEILLKSPMLVEECTRNAKYDLQNIYDSHVVAQKWKQLIDKNKN